MNIYRQVGISVIVMFGFCCETVFAQPKISTVKGEQIIPSAPFPTIDLETRDRMVRQEEKLKVIEGRLERIESSLSDIKTDIKGMAATWHVMSFLVLIAKILIPGLIIIVFGTWFWFYLHNSYKQK